ncbi:MAG: ThuA domain-containing protein [Planctomycetia bacterium]|nr:ThuA domain-containing protein [Planctomycetia bacterium]
MAAEPASDAAGNAQPWVVYEGTGDGAGKGKHIVLISGDEEYRSEEALPQLARILATRHGFRCTVLFAIGKDGTIDPLVTTNIPGLEALDHADLMVIATRFRNLPDDQMQHVADYIESGRPVIGLRTASHAFAIPAGRKFARYSWNGKEPGWEGGFGRRILGETWINHHGHHGSQSTRGVIPPAAVESPILRGIHGADIWGPTDVYEVRLPLGGDAKPLVLGEVLTGMKPGDPAVVGKQNDPMMPVAWTRTYEAPGAKRGRVFETTMGAAQDLSSEGVRRLLVNACYWCVGLEDKITEKANVELVGKYQPSPFKFGGHRHGVKPSDLALPAM